MGVYFLIEMLSAVCASIQWRSQCLVSLFKEEQSVWRCHGLAGLSTGYSVEEHVVQMPALGVE